MLHSKFELCHACGGNSGRSYQFSVSAVTLAATLKFLFLLQYKKVFINEL